MRGVSFRISFQTSLHPQNFRISKLPDTCSRAPVSLYCGALRDYDLLTAAGKTAEAHRALHLCSAAVNNGFCLESLLLPQIRSYLCCREKSDFKIYYFLQIGLIIVQYHYFLLFFLIQQLEKLFVSLFQVFLFLELLLFLLVQLFYLV